MEISLSHSIAMGHRIPNHEGGSGKCARLHGHTYRFDVQLKSAILRDGFVIDFGIVKNALNEWDHRTILWEDDPLRMADDLGGAGLVDGQYGVIRVPFIPTAEAIAIFWADCLFEELLKYHGLDIHFDNEDDLYAVLIDVWESPTTSARYVSR